MLGLLGVGINGIAAWRLFATGGGGLAGIAVLSAIASFWSWGVMSNYSAAEPAPRFATTLNIATFLLGAILLLIGFTR
jgi:hypothetical protein